MSFVFLTFKNLAKFPPPQLLSSGVAAGGTVRADERGCLARLTPGMWLAARQQEQDKGGSSVKACLGCDLVSASL